MAGNANFTNIGDLEQDGGDNFTFSEANMKYSTTTNNRGFILPFAFPSTGKYYYEMYILGVGGTQDQVFPGVCTPNTMRGNLSTSRGGATGTYGGYTYDQYHGYAVLNGTNQTADSIGYFRSFPQKMGILVNRDDNEIKWTLNGTDFSSAYTIPSGELRPYLGSGGGSTTASGYFNFGQDSTFGGNVSAGGNADSNGYGDFTFSVPSNYVSLSSANLPVSSDIDPAQTSTDIGDLQVGAVTYTGNGTSVDVTGFGFKPDLIWIKMRSPHTYNNLIFDTTRGVHKHLSSDRAATEFSTNQSITAFGTDGFTYGTELSGNDSGDSHMAWGWKANGGITSTNTDGTVASTVQANQAAGFSIVTFTGINSNTTATVGHGLGKAPTAIMHFCRTSAEYPLFRIKGATSASTLRNTNPNGSPVDVSGTSDGGAISDPTSTVFSINNYVGLGGGGFDYVAYCWAPIDGYSSFGNFKGTGDADGPFIYTGFRPKIVVLIGEPYGRENFIFDTTRNPQNHVNTYLRWGRTNTESDGTSQILDFMSSGFKIRGTFGGDINGSDENNLYMAWGDVPFKYNNAR